MVSPSTFLLLLPLLSLSLSLSLSVVEQNRGDDLAAALVKISSAVIPYLRTTNTVFKDH
jgi:hypothetical protein